jgi:hypothetical protein
MYIYIDNYILLYIYIELPSEIYHHGLIDMMIPSVWVYIPLKLNYTKYRLYINKPYGVGYKKYIIFLVLGYTY